MLLPDELYEIIALAARYWFLFLMVLIAWRSYRWYARDRKKFKKRLKLLPDAGYVGELVVVRGDEAVQRGVCLPVSREGMLGYLRSNDVCLPAGGVANRHLWYAFDDADGLLVSPLRGRMIVADGQELIGSRARAFLSHGSTLIVGQAKLRLRMFEGFEYAGELSARRRPMDDAQEQDLPEEFEQTASSASIRRMRGIAERQQMLEDEEAEQDAYGEQAYDMPEPDGEPAYYPPDPDGGQPYYPLEPDDEPDGTTAYYTPEPDDGENGYLPPLSEAELNSYELQDGSQVYYPPVRDEDELQPLSPAGELPKSAYVDEDEAATAKRVLWDKYLKGGNRR